MKKIIFILIIFVMFIGNIKADNIVDLNKKGSISINLKGENNIVGAEIQIIQIGKVNIINNNLVFEYIDELNDCNYKLSDENIKNIEVCIQNKKLNVTTKITDSNGKVLFDNLNLGVYYIKQTNKIKNFSQIDPILIMLPKEINNSFEYNIDASPKIEILDLTDIKIKKIWNTDKKDKILNHVTIELYKDKEKIETVTLNEKNNWEIVIEGLPKSDSYSVKEINLQKGYTVTYNLNEYTFTVTNTPSLVDTGQITYVYNIILFIGIMLIIVGIILKRREINEK